MDQEKIKSETPSLFKIKIEVSPEIIEFNNYGHAPMEVFEGLLDKLELDPSLMRQAIVEDFLVDQLENDIDQEQIVSNFKELGILDQVANYVKEVDEISKNLDWRAIYPENRIDLVKDKLKQKARRLNLIHGVEEAIGSDSVTFTYEHSTGEHDSNGIKLSIPQIVRKLIDYVAVSGESNIEKVLHNLTDSLVAHEIGHAIDKMAYGDARWVSEDIQMDKGWKVGINSTENRAERFAEYWARQLGEDELLVHEQDLLLVLAKVYPVWNAADNFNQRNADNKISISNLFNKLINTTEERDVKDFIASRYNYFNLQNIESYCSPYDESVIIESLSTK